MTIKELIISDIMDIRVSHEFKWLVGNMEENTEHFIVYERPLYAKKTRILYDGYDEGTAVQFLIGEGLT